MAAKLSKVGDALIVNRGMFCFANAGGGFPPETVMGRGSITEDGNSWPAAGAINTVLTEWHKAKQAMNNAWRAVPQERRTGLVAPPR